MEFDVENFWIPLAVVALIGVLGLLTFCFQKQSRSLYRNTYGRRPTRIHHMTHVGPRNDGSPEDIEFRRKFWPMYRSFLIDIAMIVTAIYILSRF